MIYSELQDDDFDLGFGGFGGNKGKKKAKSSSNNKGKDGDDGNSSTQLECLSLFDRMGN